MISRNSYLANVFLFCMLYRRQVDTIDKFQLEGRLVITDRFIEHFLLFHRHDGLMKTHGEETYKVLESLVFGHARPTVSVYLVVGLTSANKRIAARLAGGSRTDYMFETEESYRRAVELYEEIAATENCKVIDGIGDQLLVHQRVVDALNL